jgi:hypothetical protein
MRRGGYLDGDVAQIAVDSWSLLAEASRKWLAEL